MRKSHPRLDTSLQPPPLSHVSHILPPKEHSQVDNPPNQSGQAGAEGPTIYVPPKQAKPSPDTGAGADKKKQPELANSLASAVQPLMRNSESHLTEATKDLQTAKSSSTAPTSPTVTAHTQASER